MDLMLTKRNLIAGSIGVRASQGFCIFFRAVSCEQHNKYVTNLNTQDFNRKDYSYFKNVRKPKLSVYHRLCYFSVHISKAITI